VRIRWSEATDLKRGTDTRIVGVGRTVGISLIFFSGREGDGLARLGAQYDRSPPTVLLEVRWKEQVRAPAPTQLVVVQTKPVLSLTQPVVVQAQPVVQASVRAVVGGRVN